MLTRILGSHRQEMLCCNPSWRFGNWSHQRTGWVWDRRYGRWCESRAWRFVDVNDLISCDVYAQPLSLWITTQSLSLWYRPVTIPTNREQTWWGCDSYSALTQLVKNWESLACLELCSGAPVGRWWRRCSYRLAPQWRWSCLHWAPRCSAGVCWDVGLLRKHFCCRA